MGNIIKAICQCGLEADETDQGIGLHKRLMVEHYNYATLHDSFVCASLDVPIFSFISWSASANR
ncbi:hypothetical protein [Pontibacter pamirensis]|uniref:hypothetical protein n=1 Tax=Pontibacter pamirensis TaxID=2562824 RepID=UPI00138A31DD|nr:hypothetical protein [Pontibacter pamirensis]